jgi:hypothetical protein
MIDFRSFTTMTPSIKLPSKSSPQHPWDDRTLCNTALFAKKMASYDFDAENHNPTPDDSLSRPLPLLDSSPQETSYLFPNRDHDDADPSQLKGDTLSSISHLLFPSRSPFASKSPTCHSPNKTSLKDSTPPTISKWVSLFRLRSRGSDVASPPPVEELPIVKAADRDQMYLSSPLKLPNILDSSGDLIGLNSPLFDAPSPVAHADGMPSISPEILDETVHRTESTTHLPDSEQFVSHLLRFQEERISKEQFVREGMERFLQNTLPSMEADIFERSIRNRSLLSSLRETKKIEANRSPPLIDRVVSVRRISMNPMAPVAGMIGSTSYLRSSNSKVKVKKKRRRDKFGNFFRHTEDDSSEENLFESQRRDLFLQLQLQALTREVSAIVNDVLSLNFDDEESLHTLRESIRRMHSLSKRFLNLVMHDVF